MTIGATKPDGKTLTEASGILYDACMSKTEADTIDALATVLARCYEYLLRNRELRLNREIIHAGSDRLSTSVDGESGKELLKVATTGGDTGIR